MVGRVINESSLMNQFRQLSAGVALMAVAPFSSPQNARDIWLVIAPKLPVHALLRLSVCSRQFLAFIRPMAPQVCLPASLTALSPTAQFFTDYTIWSAELPPSFFTHATSLQLTRGWGPYDFSSFPRLRKLYLFGQSQLTGVPLMEDCRGHAPQLVDNDWAPFSRLTQLRMIRSPSRLETLPSSLKQLGSQIAISQITSLSHLSDLRELHVAGSGSDASAVMTFLESHFPKLEELQVKFENNIGAPDVTVLSLPPSALHITALRYSGPASLPTSLLRRLPSLKKLITSIETNEVIDWTCVTRLCELEVLGARSDWAQVFPVSLTSITFRTHYAFGFYCSVLAPLTNLRFADISFKAHDLSLLTMLESARFSGVLNGDSIGGFLSQLSHLQRLHSLELDVTVVGPRGGHHRKSLQQSIPSTVDASFLQLLTALPRLQVLYWNGGSFVKGDLRSLIDSTSAK